MCQVMLCLVITGTRMACTGSTALPRQDITPVQPALAVTFALVLLPSAQAKHPDGAKRQFHTGCKGLEACKSLDAQCQHQYAVQAWVMQACTSTHGNSKVLPQLAQIEAIEAGLHLKS